MAARRNAHEPSPCAAAIFAAALGASGTAGAQTVVEVQGGGSSLVKRLRRHRELLAQRGRMGGSALGYLDGLRIGAFLPDRGRQGHRAPRATTPLVMRFPTDLFSGGYNLLVQGVSVGRAARPAQSYLAFAGASSSSLAAPHRFQATRIDKPLGRALPAAPGSRLRCGLTGKRARGATADGDARRAMAGHTRSDDGVGGRHRARAAFYAAGGSDSSGEDRWVSRRLYAWNPDRFRRADVPWPDTDGSGAGEKRLG